MVGQLGVEISVCVPAYLEPFSFAVIKSLIGVEESERHEEDELATIYVQRSEKWLVVFGEA